MDWIFESLRRSGFNTAMGSRALAALNTAAAAVRLNGYPLDLETIPVDDEQTYRLLAAGQTLGCTQLESPGMRSLLRTMRPRCLDDVIAAISLFRPAPLAGAQDTPWEGTRQGAPRAGTAYRLTDTSAGATAEFELPAGQTRTFILQAANRPCRSVRWRQDSWAMKP